ncbi:sulfite exporter TauE/SafE family protein 3-like isoform X2 [Nymphaea colorata]|uniref:sulfite exporter TauE/SafE family protein 3-like isoform X2 n=1 Tax=Nymphaea colorata TaxID=210225 RepID=UPI00129E5D9F|nr:sulfite exporter TauE/SafE family protein 3-like isoform X2 [Nymphaea colorata]
MAERGAAAWWRNSRWAAFMALTCMSALVLATSAERNLMLRDRRAAARSKTEMDELQRLINFLRQPNLSDVYPHAWPVYYGSYMSNNVKVALGTLIGFFGAAFGSVGGVGGGGIFVPMLTLIIGFDAKSSTAISKCMIMGAAGSTVYYNLKLRHPTLPLPIIDYDLALLFQPMLMLGISIGVAFNVVFAEWMVTVLLIFIFMVTSTKAFRKGVETWKKETKMKKLARATKENEGEKLESGGNGMKTEGKDSGDESLPLLENVYWKELLILIFVWIAFLSFQISKNYTRTCSTLYWVLNFLQIPVAVGTTFFQAVNLYKGRRTIASKGEEATDWKTHQLVLHCCFGTLAGIVGGLLGLGGGFILVPLFLELGIPPQVASATATFVMTFSSSMSVVEYYLLNRIPVPYALYFIAVATAAAFVGQHVVRKLIIVLGRASIIIFILASTIFVSAISLGGVGISNMIHKIEKHEYMGFENLCSDSG